MCILVREAVMKSIQFSLVILLFSPLAIAQEIADKCPQKPEDQESATALAKVWFDKGDRLAAEKKYKEATKAFLCANTIIEHPSAVYNAAQAAMLGGEHATALALFKEWQMTATDDDRSARHAEKHIAKLEALIGEEEEEEEEEEAPIPQEPDVVDIPVEETFVVAPLDEKPAENKNKNNRAKLATAGWISLAAGGAGLIAGSVLQGLSGKAAQDADRTEKWSEFETLQKRTDDFQKGAIVGFAIGGVLTGAGVTMIVLAKGNSDQGAHVEILAGFDRLTFVGKF